MKTTTTTLTSGRDAADLPTCTPTPADERGEPGRCVIANLVKNQIPWARHVTVGTATIRFYDYRCEHNPEGRTGGCDGCPGRCLELATPLAAADAIRAFDRGEDPVFPKFTFRPEEARVIAARQDPVRKAQIMRTYREEVATGLRKVNHLSARAKARAKSKRRRG
jgi:hypothetical protein